MSKAGQWAFPNPYFSNVMGMSYHQWLVGQALNGILANSDVRSWTTAKVREDIAATAVRFADAVAQVDTDRNGEDAKQASCASSGSAVPEGDAPEPSGEPSNTPQDTGETR